MSVLQGGMRAVRRRRCVVRMRRERRLGTRRTENGRQGDGLCEGAPGSEGGPAVGPLPAIGRLRGGATKGAGERGKTLSRFRIVFRHRKVRRKRRSPNPSLGDGRTGSQLAAHAPEERAAACGSSGSHGSQEPGFDSKSGRPVLPDDKKIRSDEPGAIRIRPKLPGRENGEGKAKNSMFRSYDSLLYIRSGRRGGRHGAVPFSRVGRAGP